MDDIRLTAKELEYLEACMQVADGEGEHAASYLIDCGELQRKLADMRVIEMATELQLGQFVEKK